MSQTTTAENPAVSPRTILIPLALTRASRRDCSRYGVVLVVDVGLEDVMVLVTVVASLTVVVVLTVDVSVLAVFVEVVVVGVAVAVVVGFTIVVVWPMLIEFVGAFDEPPFFASTMITTTTAIATATPPAMAQPWPPDVPFGPRGGGAGDWAPA